MSVTDNHPYRTFRVIPNPASYVDARISDEALDVAFKRHKKLISERNKVLLPARVVSKMKRIRKQRTQ